MREIVRPVVAALSIACLAASMAIVSSDGALAQAPSSRWRRLKPRRRRTLP